MTIIQAPPVGTVARLRETFETGRTRDRTWRAAQLAALDRMLIEREDDFVGALVADLGRTPFESVLFDLAPTRAEIKHARSHLRRWMRRRRVAAPINARPGRAWYQYEPLGVTMIIGAWNYPVHL